MNRGVYQSSLLQQMMGGSPSWWSMNNMRLTPEQTFPLLPSSSSSSSTSSSIFPQYLQPSTVIPMNPCWPQSHDLPESWSQLLLGGLVGEEEAYGLTPLQSKNLENWEHQVMYPSASVLTSDVKEEYPGGGYVHSRGIEEIQTCKSALSQILPTSSPRSCITASFSSNMLDFSSNKMERRHHRPNNSSECNSTATGAFKKARVQGSSSPPSTFKARKEKLGDRITALHQLVSPFGKTDTASVLLEAIGYIRFLQGQIEALSSPYLGNKRQLPAKAGERTCLFPEDSGQLLNESGIKRRGPTDQEDNKEEKKDLRSRGLCLVPVSFTLHVGSDNGADFWAPTFGGGSLIWNSP